MPLHYKLSDYSNNFNVLGLAVDNCFAGFIFVTLLGPTQTSGRMATY